MIDLDWILTVKPDSPVSAKIIGALRPGLLRYLEGEPLDSALEFRGKRIRSIHLKNVRDFHLRGAASVIEASGSSNRAALLEAEINRFLSCTWPRWRELSSPPDRCSILHRNLFHAAKTKTKLPGYRQLLRIL